MKTERCQGIRLIPQNNLKYEVIQQEILDTQIGILE